jgi:hydroxyacylglutathione hydrolase
MNTSYLPGPSHCTSRRAFIEKSGTCAVLFFITPLLLTHKKYTLDPFQDIYADEVQFPEKWIHGSIQCQDNNDPPIQVHQVNPGTYILRQNKCSTYEAPFLYLFIGEEKAFLLDTGDRVPGDALLTTVESLLPDPKGNKNGKNFDLIVAHTHGHSDHTYGDSHFRRRPNTEIVPAGQNAVRTFFRIQEWLDSPATVDLGGRMLTIVPIPGHTLDHIAVYDDKTHFLMTGDTLYPGNLYVRF